jgi:hypothetical protein
MTLLRRMSGREYRDICILTTNLSPTTPLIIKYLFMMQCLALLNLDLIGWRLRALLRLRIGRMFRSMRLRSLHGNFMDVRPIPSLIS